MSQSRGVPQRTRVRITRPVDDGDFALEPGDDTRLPVAVAQRLIETGRAVAVAEQP